MLQPIGSRTTVPSQIGWYSYTYEILNADVITLERWKWYMSRFALYALIFKAEIKEDDESAERALRLFLAIDAQMTNFVWGFQRGEAEKKEDERDSFRLCERSSLNSAKLCVLCAFALKKT